jgi:long-chain acyl-CoA synthetase
MMKKLAEAGPIVGMVFGLAVKGKQTLPWPLSAVIDKVLFSRVKQATGGRLRAAVCGGKSAEHRNKPSGNWLTLPGGNLSKETQRFLSTVLAPMQQGESTSDLESSESD